jgi:hypothetical protein
LYALSQAVKRATNSLRRGDPCWLLNMGFREFAF